MGEIDEFFQKNIPLIFNLLDAHLAPCDKLLRRFQPFRDSTSMDARDRFLERVKAALGRGPYDPLSTPSDRSTLPPLGKVLPPLAPGEEVARFEAELAKVAGNAYRAATRKELSLHLLGILEPVTEVALSRNPLLERLGIGGLLAQAGKQVTWWPHAQGSAHHATEAQGFREAVFSAGAGITGVECVLAESGTLVLSSLREGTQLASLAPPVHVAVYTRDQVVATLEEALARIPVPRSPEEAAPGRSVVLITGPSRTADIEQILIRGVHGPKHLHAILVEDACLA
jgi:L-lactate dehydrogenase complex protein LldG